MVLGPSVVFLTADNSLNPAWNSSCTGCTDSSALNYDPTATVDDGSCVYGAAPLFFSEHSDGGGFNRYFEIYNPTQDTVVLDDYAVFVYPTEIILPIIHYYFREKLKT